ncbi:MAG: hypothetical protein OEM27_02920 [Nitrospinota bacterium]|nr:hypothetical protein [Nitrospinota bacterium]
MIKRSAFLKFLSLMSLTVFAGCYSAPAGTTHTGFMHKDHAVAAAKTAESGWTTASMSYPTGIESTSNIRVDKHFPNTVLKGQPYTYDINVTNLTNLDLENVNIVETFPADFETISTEPVIFDSSGDKVAWALGKLPAKSTRVIKVTGKANSTDDIPCCTEANFKAPALCLKTAVVDSGLALSLKAPEQKLMCDQIPLEYTVKNTGTSDLRDVMVSSTLPENVIAEDGGNIVSHRIGHLAPGQEQKILTTVQAKAPGEYSFGGSSSGVPNISNSAAGTVSNITADSNAATTNVSKPQLSIKSVGAEDKQYIGRPISYDFEVTNTGDVNAESAMLAAAIPANAAFKSANSAGSFSQATRAVTWDLGTLKPNDSKTVSMTLSGYEAGNAVAKAEANAMCADVVYASQSNPVVGVPALLLELVDLSDPLSVGDTTIYQVTVTNQGTGPATNVALVGGFEDMSYITSSGHTPIRNLDKGLAFGTFSLDPKESVNWQIQLKADQVGDQRFKLMMKSDQMTRPVEETESTTIY